jgi:hypothetical protein
MAADPSGGFAAQHPARRSLPVLVAPSLGDEKNTIAIADVPLACWRLDAARFDFDSSVIRPEAEDELTLLAGMFDSNGGPALTVFGHADPVGDDEYNKALSGRRTKALYGLLTRDTAMWNELATSEAWPQAAFTMMQARTGKPAGTPRDELFRAYMDAICHRADGTPFTVDRSGFLGKGLDPGGKADYQGCSEFNPVLRFSAAEEQELSPQERHPERDERNAPNRRVLVFMFTAGTFAPAADWPCPRATESAGGCRPQFWPDGDQRRAAQDQERTYERDKDTFACAHYDRMARRSPCEQLRLEIFADFNEDGQLKLDASDHDVRETGLGAIILADLDVNNRTLPRTATTGSPQTLDADAPTHDPKDPELLPVTVKPTVGAPTVDGGVDISGVMSNRFRVLDGSGGALKTGVRFDRSFVTWSGAQTDLLLLVNGLPGSPLSRGETSLLKTDVPPPRPASPPDETESTVRLTIFTGGGTVQDSGLFTVAPFLLMHNLLEPERIYIADQPGNPDGKTPSGIDGNQPTVADLESELKSISGVVLVKVPLSANNGDAWLQDQFQVGYCHAPSGTLRIACHLPRTVKNVTHTTADVNNLAGFVESHFPSRGIGLFRDFWNRSFVGQDADGKDFFLPFTDTYATHMAMLRVFNFRRRLIPMLAGSGIRFADPDGYSGARLQLEPLFQDVKDILEAKLELARAANDTRSVTELQSTEADIDKLKADVDRDTPLGGAAFSRRFGIPVPNQVELTKDQVDTVQERISLTHESLNYGGNILASPPFSTARLGKIVVGSNPNRTADPDLIYFLRAQGKQPLVQIDTSWLDVGHADEIVAFVPRPNKDPNFAILHASPSLAMALIRAAKEAWEDGIPAGRFHDLDIRRVEAIDTTATERNMTHQKNATAPVTHMLRGKLWLHSQQRGSFDPVMPPRIYQKLVDNYSKGIQQRNALPFTPGSGPDRFYPANLNVVEMIFSGGDENDAIDSDHITALRAALEPEFPGVAMFELPVLFDIPLDARTSSFTPDIVNLQVLGEHIFMPRPYGPRMLHAQAIDVVKTVVKDRPDRTGDLGNEIAAQLAQIDVKRLAPTVHWANGGAELSSDTDRDPNLDPFAEGFPPDRQGNSHHKELIIARNPKEFENGQLRPGWHRLLIPEGKGDGTTRGPKQPFVDLFELYVEALMAALGLKLHWVDSWYYHVRFGELHCGTNVLRKPKLDPKWWQV